MDCKTKDGLLIFLLVFSGVLLAALLVIIALFCRKKVNTDVKQWDSPIYKYMVIYLVVILPPHVNTAALHRYDSN